MKRIYDFSSFSRLYEAEEEKKDKPYVGLLKQILSYLNTCYMSQIKLAGDPYDPKIMGDLDLIAKTPGVDSYKKILANVKAAVDKESPEAKEASDAWSASGEKFASALAKLYEKLPDAKEGINKEITNFINLQKQNLQKASQENKLKPQEGKDEKKNESYSYQFDSLNEGLFKTKKGLFNKLSKEVTINMALLKNSASVPGMADEVKTQQSKIDGIISKLASKKVDDMEKDELEKDLETLASIPVSISKKSEELAKEDTANKEAAAVFIDAVQSLGAANEKDKKFVEKTKAEEESDKSSVEKIRTELGWKGKTIKKEEAEKKGKSGIVSKIQKSIITIFKDDIKDSEVFKKFSEGKFAGDGFFGDNTGKMIKGLKAGFGLKDDSPDITEELMDKIAQYKLSKDKKSSKTNESYDFGRLQSFRSFELIEEKIKISFDQNKFKEAIGEKGEKGKDLPKVEELKDKLDGMVKDSYDKHKEGIDYILDKDFEPSEEGKKLFGVIFRVPWSSFKEKLNDVQKKNTVAMGFKTTLEPTTGIDKGIGKEVVDIYLKKKGEEKK